MTLSITNKIKEFGKQNESVFQPSPLTFPQLDADTIKNKLKLKEEAVERGKHNLPLTSTKTFDDIEEQIVTYINDRRNDVSESYYDSNKAFEDRVNRLSSMGSVAKLEGIAGSTEADFKKHTHKSKFDIYKSLSGLKSMERYIDKFKKENKLERPALFKKNFFLHYSIIAFLIVIETVMNGYFFAKGNEFGLVGGVANAAIPSILNIVIAYFIGNFGFRLLPCVSSKKKLGGITICIVLSLLILVINLSVAHFRSSMVQGIENPTQAAFEALISSPLSLIDIESWLLFIMGCFFAVIATIKIWMSDDYYYDFGRISRIHQERISEYKDEISYAIEVLQAIRDDGLNEVDEEYNLIVSRNDEVNSIFDNQRRWATLFDQYLIHLEAVGKTLLAYYRNYNTSTRTTNPPKHFLKEWKLTNTSKPETTLDFQKVIKDFKEDTDKAEGFYISSTTRINDAFNIAFNEYQTIEQLNPEEVEQWLEGKTILKSIEEMEAAA